MHDRDACLSLALAFASLLAPATLHADEPVTVYTTVDRDVTAEQRALFEESLRRELSKYQGLAPVTANAPRDGTSAPEQCPEQAIACLTALAEALGAQSVVAARLTSLGDVRVITLKYLDIGRAEIVASVTKQLTASAPEAYLLILGDTVAELMGSRSLRDGTTAGVAGELVRRWQPPPLPQWIFWTSAGLTATATGSALIYALLARDAENEFNTLARTTGTIDGRRLAQLEKSAESRAQAANILWGVTAALAVGTTVAFFFTDFGAEETLTVAGGPASGGGWIGLTLRL